MVFIIFNNDNCNHDNDFFSSQHQQLFNTRQYHQYFLDDQQPWQRFYHQPFLSCQSFWWQHCVNHPCKYHEKEDVGRSSCRPQVSCNGRWSRHGTSWCSQWYYYPQNRFISQEDGECVSGHLMQFSQLTHFKIQVLTAVFNFLLT